LLPSTEKPRSGFFEDFGKFFLKGLAAILPTLLTIALLIWAYQLVDDYIGQYITKGFIAILARTAGSPKPEMADPDVDTLKYGSPIDQLDAQGRRLTREYQITHSSSHKGDPRIRGDESLEYRTVMWRMAFAKYRLGLVGFLIAVSLVYFVGFFVASFIGRTTWRMLERVQERVPLVNAIYPPIKQVTDFLLSEKKHASGGVVAVEYPRKGIWSIGLLTGPGLRTLSGGKPDSMVSVFIPNSPTPITGYVVVVPRSDIVELAISMDEALRFVISGGVIMPEKESWPGRITDSVNAGAQSERLVAPSSHEPSGSAEAVMGPSERNNSNPREFRS